MRPESAAEAPVSYQNNRLVIVSLMSGSGSTGVENHFLNLTNVAESRGVRVDLVTPYSQTKWLQRIYNFVANCGMRIDPERASLWLRRVHSARIGKHLRSAIQRPSNERLVLYAQDPLSAKLALEVRAEYQCEVVCAVHFNVSEAEEFCAKGVTTPGGRLWNELDKTELESLPHVSRLLFVSQFMRKTTFERLRLGSRTEAYVLPNFTAHDKPQAATQEPIADAISIGSLEPRKNQQFLIRVLAECKARGYVFTLSLIGEGEDRNMLQQLAVELGVAQQIYFYGFHKAAGQLIARHKVFLHAASMESFGIVLLESLAAGVPVIANPVGGVPEVFRDGIEGRYWDGANVEVGASKLVQLLRDPIEYERMAARARFRFETHFCPETISQKWLDAIFADTD